MRRLRVSVVKERFCNGNIDEMKYREIIEQRVQFSDKAINAAVYALYGLSAEEISAVEE